MLFEPNAENLLELQKYMHDPLKWWLYDTCAVHHVSIKKGQDIFMLVEDYPLTKGLATLMLVNKLRVDQHSEMADELLTKIYNISKTNQGTKVFGKHPQQSYIRRKLEICVSLDLSRLATTLNRLERSIKSGIYTPLQNVPQYFTKTFRREFWCTAISYDPSPPPNDCVDRPLKEYLIKFSVMNEQKRLTLDYQTFCSSTSLDYNKGKYVAHPSPEAFKAELAKIVLGENYSSTEQINYIEQMIAYCLITRTENPSKVIDIELTGHMIAVSNQKDSVYPLPISGKKKKVKSQTPTEDSEQSHSFSSSTVPDPQDLERNIQLSGTGLPSTQLDEPADTRLPSMVSNEGTVKTTPLPEGPLKDKDLEGFKPPADMKPINPFVADLLRTGAEYQILNSLRMKWLKRGDEDVFAAGEDMDEDTQATKEEHQSPPSNIDEPKSSHIQDTNESASYSSSPELQKYDNILTLTERQLVKASIKGYYEENVDHMDHIDKLVQANIDCLDKNSTKRAELLTALNGFNETLKVIQEAVKEDHALNKKALNLGSRMTAIKNSQAAIRSEAHTKEPPSHTEGEHVSMKDDTKKSESDKVERPTRAVPILAFRLLMRPNHEVEIMSSPSTVRLTDTVLEFLIFDSGTKIELITSLRPQPTETPASEAQPITTIINISQPEMLASNVFREDPDEPIRVPYMINGKMYHLTNDEINEHLEKEDKIKKAAEEAKRFKMTKTEVIKIVQEEAEKIGIDPKKIISAKQYTRSVVDSCQTYANPMLVLILILTDKEGFQPERLCNDYLSQGDISFLDLDCSSTDPETSPIFCLLAGGF
ncbi:hypothetical protein Tco_0716934 [Tanacetum coccineum]